LRSKCGDLAVIEKRRLKLSKVLVLTGLAGLLLCGSIAARERKFGLGIMECFL